MFRVRPEIIIGPPGCGKTTELLRQIEGELAAGTAPNRIALVTFTRRGAEEAITRACDKFGLMQSDFPYFRTLHSLCFRWLGLRRDDVLEGPRLREFADFAGVRLTGRWSDDGTMLGFASGDRILFMENMARVRKIPLRDQYDLYDDDDLPWGEVDRVSRALDVFKRGHNLLDYSDMLQKFVDGKARIPIEVLVVDEAQDLSLLQWEVVYQLATLARRVIIACDDDQAIFAWAGADVDTIVKMPGDVRVLGQSWRVPRVVQSLADEVISAVDNRRPKEWAPRPDDGHLERAADISAVDVEEGDVLILARNAYVLREQVEPELRHRGIVYDWQGKSSIDHEILRVIKNWESLRAGASLPVEDIREIYRYLTSGRTVAAGHRLLPQLSDDDPPLTMDELVGGHGLLTRDVWHEALDRLPAEEMSYILAARRRGESLVQRPRVRLSTIHASKGGEADHVVLMTEMAKRTYQEWRENPEEEARVWYVGVTRARQRLTVVSSRTSQFFPL